MEKGGESGTFKPWGKGREIPKKTVCCANYFAPNVREKKKMGGRFTPRERGGVDRGFQKEKKGRGLSLKEERKKLPT